MLHKHYLTGYPNVEISNTKLPLDLTNKILEIVSREDDGRHNIMRYHNIPKYLSFEKEKTQIRRFTQQILQKRYETHHD